MASKVQNPTIINTQGNGEVTVNLNLTIKLEGNGLSVTTTAVPGVVTEKPKEEKFEYILPDDIGNLGLIDFGKEVK